MSYKLPGFIPGKHCTGFHEQLVELSTGHGEGKYRYTCLDCVEKAKPHERRSAAAFKAVATKRRKYTKWPANYKGQRHEKR